jgi:hypothetical protein
VDALFQEGTNNPGGQKYCLSACAHFSPHSMAYPDHLAFIRYPLFIYRRGLFREINYVG